MLKWIAVIAVLWPAAAAAQQQQVTPTQMAHAIDDAVYSLAQSVETDQRIIAVLKQQIADLQAKCGKPCEDKK